MGTVATRRTRAWPVVAAFAVCVAALSGCSSTSTLSNASVSVCYRAIPVGRSSLHTDQARLVGVHELPLDKVRLSLPAAEKANLAAEDDTEICAMAFSGTFSPGQVQLAPAGESGKIAIVLVTEKRLRLVAAAVIAKVPRGLGGRNL
ncbi:MAG: hypothetical protein ACP5P1_14925 [Acidimicrobiales bacterium]